MSNIYKIFSMTLLQRLTPFIDKKQPIEQAGFMKGFSTIDHLHTLSQIIEKHKEFQLPLYIGLIDFKKAFDSITHPSIWQALCNQDIPKCYIQVIKKIYEKSTARVKTDKMGRKIQINRGVRQGDPMSPKLFLAVLEEIFKNLKWKERKKGIKIEGKYLSNLRFADDLVILANSATELRILLQELSTQSKNVGLEMNQQKTKVMTNSKEINIIIENTPLEYVHEYVYLGKQISFNDCTNKEIERRIGQTWKKYWAMKNIFKAKIPMKLKRLAFNTCILPCLTYGSQTWTLTKDTIKKIQVCQRSIERSILNIRLSDRIRITEIKRRTKFIDTVEHILKQKFKWAGHMVRMPNIRWTKTITNWKPKIGKRKVGKPNARWEKDLLETVGKDWKKVAMDRQTWKNMLDKYLARIGNGDSEEA